MCTTIFQSLSIWLLCILSWASGAEVKLVWLANLPTENVAFYQVRADETWGFTSFTGTTNGTTYTFTGLKRNTLYTFSVVAVNSAGVSGAALLSYTVPYRVRVIFKKGSDLNRANGATYGSQEFNVVNPKEFYWNEIEQLP